MNPEMMLDLQTDLGVKPLSERARRVMLKYGGGAAATLPPKAHVEPVLLSAPAKPVDAPLQAGEIQAKRLKELAAARSLRTLGVAFQGWREAAPPPGNAGRPKSSSRVRAVAAVIAARADMPESLGGEVEVPGDEEDASPTAELEAVVQEETAPGQGAAAAAAAIPELCALWTADCEEWCEDGRAFCVRYSPDGTLLAAGCGDGSVRILHANSGRVAYTLAASDGAEEDGGDGDGGGGGGGGGAAAQLPITCIRWTGSRTLLAATAGGTVEAWKAGPTPSCLHRIVEEGNQIYALEYSAGQTPGSGQFATAGRDTCVRLYDERTMRLTCTLGLADPELRRYEGSNGMAVGHTSRVFSLRFVPNEPHLLVSAGWDRVVRFWDTRRGEAIRTIPECHVCGDALDVLGDELLVGAFASPQAPVRVYDVRSGVPLADAAWEKAGGATRTGTGTGGGGGSGGCKVYAAQFSHAAAGLVAAAGVGAVDGQGELRIFRRDGLRPIGRAPAARGVTALDVTSAVGKLQPGEIGCRVATVSGATVSVYEVREPTQDLN